MQQQEIKNKLEGYKPKTTATPLPFLFRGASNVHSPDRVKKNGLVPTQSGLLCEGGDKPLFYDGRISDPFLLDLAAQTLKINLSPDPENPQLPFLTPGSNRGYTATTADLKVAMRYALKRFIRDYTSLKSLSQSINAGEKSSSIPINAWIYVIDSTNLLPVNITADYAWPDIPMGLQEHEFTMPTTISPQQILGYFKIKLDPFIQTDPAGYTYLLATLAPLTTFAGVDNNELLSQLPNYTHNMSNYHFMIAENGQMLQERSPPSIRFPPLSVLRHTQWQQHPTKKHFLSCDNLPEFYQGFTSTHTHSQSAELTTNTNFQPVELTIKDHPLLNIYATWVCKMIEGSTGLEKGSTELKQAMEEIKKQIIAFITFTGKDTKTTCTTNLMIPASPLYNLTEAYRQLLAKGLARNSYSAFFKDRTYLVLPEANKIPKVIHRLGKKQTTIKK